MLRDFQLSFRDGFCSAAPEGGKQEDELNMNYDLVCGGGDGYQRLQYKIDSDNNEQQRRVLVSIMSEASLGLKMKRMKLSMKPKAKFKKAIIAFGERLKIPVDDLEFKVNGRPMTGVELVSELVDKILIASLKNIDCEVKGDSAHLN